MITEIAQIDVKPGSEKDFEAAEELPLSLEHWRRQSAARVSRPQPATA